MNPHSGAGYYRVTLLGISARFAVTVGVERLIAERLRVGVVAAFAALGVQLAIAELHRDPMELLLRAGVLEKIGTTMIFEDLEEIIPAFGRANTLYVGEIAREAQSTPRNIR